MSKLLENPALLVGLVRAVMVLLGSFGIGITGAQQDAVLAFVEALLLAAASLALTAVTLRTTTSTANPTLNVGTVVTTPSGAPAAVKLTV